MNPVHSRLGFSTRSPWRALAASLLLSTLASLHQLTFAAPETAPPPASLAIGGAVRTPLTLNRADLAALPRTTLTAPDKSGADIIYQGVELAELLRRAGAPLGQELRGPALSLAILITASDGYHAVFALAELDPAITDKKALLADTADGKPLPPETGPLRLVIPGEKRHARWVRQVTRIDVIRVDSNPAAPHP